MLRLNEVEEQVRNRLLRHLIRVDHSVRGYAKGARGIERSMDQLEGEPSEVEGLDLLAWWMLDQVKIRDEEQRPVGSATNGALLTWLEIRKLGGKESIEC